MRYLSLLESCLQRCRDSVLSFLSSGSKLTPVGPNQFGDSTYEVDLVAERVILEQMSREIGSATFVSEESGVVKGGEGGLLIVIDPVDGSTNALRGYPCFSTSVAIAEGESLSQVLAGGVINLVTGDIFLAEKGRGAYLNNKRLEVSKTSHVQDALIASDLNTKGRFSNYIRRISRVLESAQHVRFLGTDALEMCLVASGAADAFVDLRGLLRSVDIAASTLIVREAGGLVLSPEGSNLEITLNPPSRLSLVACSTKELFEEIVQLVE